VVGSKAPAKKAPAKKAPAKKAPAKKAPAKKAPAKKAPAKKAPAKKAPAKKVEGIQVPDVEESADDVLARIMKDIGNHSDFNISAEEISTSPTSEDHLGIKIQANRRRSLPLILVVAAIALIIAGFWGKQIVRSLGIPIDPKPYTSVYFEDPTVVQRGIVAGDLIVFGVHNGSTNSRNLHWSAQTGTTTLTQGQIQVAANGDSHQAFSSTGAIPGQLLSIYIQDTTAPITVQIVD